MITTQTLKNAARAIEHDLWTDPSTQANYLVKDGAILRRWEPVEDDGDAFRLAISLGLSIDLSCPDCEEVRILSKNGCHLTGFTDENVALGVRHAIVRSAARIGEGAWD